LSSYSPAFLFEPSAVLRIVRHTRDIHRHSGRQTHLPRVAGVWCVCVCVCVCVAHIDPHKRDAALTQTRTAADSMKTKLINERQSVPPRTETTEGMKKTLKKHTAGHCKGSGYKIRSICPYCTRGPINGYPVTGGEIHKSHCPCVVNLLQDVAVNGTFQNMCLELTERVTAFLV
jgi:hypothetical protein